jgi:hypothetical protein
LISPQLLHELVREQAVEEEDEKEGYDDTQKDVNDRKSLDKAVPSRGGCAHKLAVLLDRLQLAGEKCERVGAHIKYKQQSHSQLDYTFSEDLELAEGVEHGHKTLYAIEHDTPNGQKATDVGQVDVSLAGKLYAVKDFDLKEASVDDLQRDEKAVVGGHQYC